MKHLFVFFQLLFLLFFFYFGKVLQFDWFTTLQLASIVLGLWAIRSVGENNWSVYPIPNKDSTITSTGPFGYIRHPIYTALLLFMAGIALRSYGWIIWMVYGLLLILLVLKIVYEEKQLLAKHAEYADFKKTTKKRLIPYIW
ncbi:MAG: isoprenylcysteine carboxylmethyltransferase family protein [Bacteroidia bacterium]|jgi:protein-S-isoprenylcysteine O-methyltransferase Ste14|nr:isoprenylcysteine carboxylmethyltransferase family protein [Bacteroidia bacterium]